MPWRTRAAPTTPSSRTCARPAPTSADVGRSISSWARVRDHGPKRSRATVTGGNAQCGRRSVWIVALAQRRSVGVSGWAAQQGKRCSTGPPGLDTVAQILQGFLALLAAGVNHREHALHEAAALRAVRPAARLA